MDATLNLKADKKKVLAGNKLCIPVISNCNKDGFEIASSLNEASHYCLVDLEDKTKDFIHLDDIREIFQNNYGNGFQTLNISTVICGKVSQMGLKILNNAGISVISPIGAHLEKNIVHYQNRELSPLNNQIDASLSSCATSCNTCASGCG